MQQLSVTLIQDQIHWHDPLANRDMYDAYFGAIENTDLVILPETFNVGFSMHPDHAFETMEGETVHWMLSRANQLSAVITGSVVLKLESGQFINRMIWAKPDGTMDYYDKRHLFRFANEHVNFTSGKKRVITQIGDWRVAIFICYDLRFPVWSRNKNDYDLAIYVANWPNARQFAWDSLLTARAIENQSYVAGVNRVGRDGLGNQFTGGSVMRDFMGKAVADLKDKSGFQTVLLSKTDLLEFRSHFPAALDADEFTITDE